MNVAAIARDTRPVAQLDDVGHTFGFGSVAVVAVRNATCVVTRGGRVAIMGPSGSGKSTLLHLLAGLEPPTSGSISWPDLEGGPNGHPENVGIVFQGASLIPTLDALENVSLPLLISGAKPEDARTRGLEAMDELGIADLASHLPDSLSGGQAQRVAVARALAGRPRLILADEPTGQLDHATGLRAIDVILAAADRSQAALIVTTHDPDIATRLTTNWQMSDGLLTTDKQTPIKTQEQ